MMAKLNRHKKGPPSEYEKQLRHDAVLFGLAHVQGVADREGVKYTIHDGTTTIVNMILTKKEK